MDLIEGPEALPRSCRILIVGGGLAGLQVARELEHRGLSEAIVIEGGPADDLRHVHTAHPPAQARRVWLAPEHDPCFRRRWTTRTPPHYSGLSGLRQRLGGRSLYWHGVVLPIEPWALREPWWPRALIADLCDSWQQGAGLYERVQRELHEWRNLGSPGSPAEESPVFDIADYSWRLTPRAVRRGARESGRWHAYSPLDHWRDAETGAVRRRPPGLRFFADLEVIQVVIRGSAARGVVVRPKGRREPLGIQADAVVLAAGTLENARLAIQALTDARALATPRLTGLADHLVQGVWVRLAPPHSARWQKRFPLGSFYATCPEARSNLFLELEPLNDGELFVDLQLTGEQLPSSANEVRCEPGDEGPWPVTVHAATAPEDRAVLAAQQRILEKVWRTLGLALDLPAGTLAFADYDRPARLNPFLLDGPIGHAPVTWCNSLGTEDHEGGTLPLGGLLTDDHEFAAISGLFAAGPSSFPRLGAANPGLTVLALARRLAAKLADRLERT